MATFCLIHGGWHDESSWDPVVDRLRERGHSTIAPYLPLHDPEAGFEQRARPAIEALEGVAGQVVIVGHSAGSSYAALVAAATPDPLLVLLCPRLTGLAPPAGAPAMFREGFPFPPQGPDGTSVWEPEAAIAAMYPRLPPETARALTKRLRPLAPPPDEYPLPGYPVVPTALVYAAEDELFDPAWQRFMAREALGVEPIEIPGGHFPMAEDPDELADLLDRLAREYASRSSAD
jgi:pimeloyl-ACP methyl ester carboxylesterase